MNLKALRSITDLGARVDRRLIARGAAMLAATHAWQSPLRSGAAKGPKGEVSDPTAGAVLTPDPLAGLHHAYLGLLLAKERADSDLLAFHHRHDPLAEDQINRGRPTGDPGCEVCSGPTPPGHRHGGKCDACHQAWLRADRPTMTTFRRQRLAHLEAERRRRYEHEAS